MVQLQGGAKQHLDDYMRRILCGSGQQVLRIVLRCRRDIQPELLQLLNRVDMECLEDTQHEDG